ncbi:hypothetical protein [Streptosporangium album]|uniref:hypothetical protein n=1 Tax=Streptosporangium album TaxID=47479 RepID=UPI0031EFABFC
MIAVATALQESGLRNLPHGHLDSLGLFQQRPSQGWGTREQILDPTYAARRLYKRLTAVRAPASAPSNSRAPSRFHPPPQGTAGRAQQLGHPPPRRSAQSAGTRPAGPGTGWSTGRLSGGANAGPDSWNFEVV